MNKKFSVSCLLDILVYGLLAILLTLLQTVLLPRFPIYDALPDIAVGALCCIGIYRGDRYGAVFGLVVGLLIDALGGIGLSVLPIYYTLAGMICGRVGANTREKKQFAAYLISVPTLCLTRTAISFIMNIISYYGSVNLTKLCLYTLLPEYISDIILCIPVFLLVKLFDIPLNLARKRGGLY